MVGDTHRVFVGALKATEGRSSFSRWRDESESRTFCTRSDMGRGSAHRDVATTGRTSSANSSAKRRRCLATGSSPHLGAGNTPKPRFRLSRSKPAASGPLRGVFNSTLLLGLLRTKNPQDLRDTKVRNFWICHPRPINSKRGGVEDFKSRGILFRTGGQIFVLLLDYRLIRTG